MEPNTRGIQLVCISADIPTRLMSGRANASGDIMPRENTFKSGVALPNQTTSVAVISYSATQPRPDPVTYWWELRRTSHAIFRSCIC